ncbi:unnamed protein product [Mesocestoides corti]|nr:unnamed protein product [Mesocestoides corti]
MPLRSATPPLLVPYMTLQSAPDKSSDHFCLLPNEVILRIFSYLDPDQLIACGQVCRRWHHLSSDWHLWEAKLFETQWCTIVCPEPPPRDMPIPLPKNPLRDPSSIHPRAVYRFLSQYIPKCDGGAGTEGTDPSTSPDAEPLDPPSPRTHTNQLSNIVNAIIYHVRELLSSRHSNPSGSSATGASANRPRFALFGPGLDHRYTSRLFWKMVDTRTRSFEPINVFTGHMGFESGITLRLFAQAQRAVMDGSTRCSASRKVSCDSAAASAKTSTSRFASCLSAPSTPPSRSPVPVVQHSTEYPCQCHQHEDFTFDLSYLYSLPPHLKHVFNDQYTRLRVSRLFFHNEDEAGADAVSVQRDHSSELDDFLSQLVVTNEMRELCRKLDGIIYAIDARESADQLVLLYHELRAVLRAFPERTARRIPIVVLYIMPKEDIKFERKQKLVVKPELVNRDSYSGAEYTAAWHDSVLLVISVLKLFELPNPWRLQKCSSNDIKTLIQSLMWLNLKYLRPVAVTLTGA